MMSMNLKRDEREHRNVMKEQSRVTRLSKSLVEAPTKSGTINRRDPICKITGLVTGLTNNIYSL